MAQITQNIANDKLDAQHEIVEMIVAQTHYVAIWGHSHSDFADKIYSVDVHELPEDFHSMMDMHFFTTETKRDVGVSVDVDLGKVVRSEWHDTFESAYAVIAELLHQHDARIREHG